MSADKVYSDEDEQAFTMQRITDMLIAAGYFRARIAGLHVFDVVVGGMSWAITASGVPVEVDVNFTENAKIGEKILISEQIVAALVEMACPFHLKPHQIQGLQLNCFPLFPIVQWLVKSVIDYRRITGDTVRNYSRFLFDSSTSDLGGNHLDRSQTTESGREYLVHSVADRYRLNRQFSKQRDAAFASKESLVDATLLEYAFHFRAHIAFGADDVDGDGDGDGDGHRPGAATADLAADADHAAPTRSTNKLHQKYGDLMSKIGGGSAPSGGPKDDGKEMDDALETAEEEEQRLSQLRTKMTEEEALRNVSGSTLVGIIDRDAVQSGKGLLHSLCFDALSLRQKALRFKLHSFLFFENAAALSMAAESD